MRRAVLAAGLVLATAGPPAASAQDPAPGTPAWHAREAQNFAGAFQRTLDRAAQPASFSPTGDPLRAPSRWAPARGAVLVQRFTNRYGASLAITLFRPPGDAPRPLPAVLLIPGAGNGQETLHWLAEDLAEHGYVAAILDPQGQGASDSRPAEQFCRPGDWQRPQEMGIAEQGACAGDAPASESPGDIAALKLGIITGRNFPMQDLAATYRAFAPRFVFGTLDALGWLLSGANPWRSWVDAGRVGLAGHSVGAYAAAQVANGDPHRRVHAAVAMDSYHPLDRDVAPRVPTLWWQGEQEDSGPRLAPPEDPEALHPPRGSFDAARAAGVPAATLTLRGSTHADFVDGATPASRHGQRVAAHGTLAWFDRFLRGDRGAIRRLLADRLDDSVDGSSIGTGTVGPDGANAPIRVAGRSRADRLSFYYPSRAALFGADCRDLRRSACEVPPARVDARVVRRTPRRLVLALRLIAGDPEPVSVRVRRGGRTVARAAGPVDLGTGGDEVRVRVPIARRARGTGQLSIGAPGFEHRQRIRLDLARPLRSCFASRPCFAADVRRR